MKRFISGLLVVVMLLAGIAALADDDIVTFDANLTKALDYSQSKWMGTGTNRALFTWLALLDYTMAVSDAEVDWSWGTFVAQKDSFVSLFMHLTDGKSVVVNFDPNSGYAGYFYMDFSDATTMEAVIKAGTDAYYENSLDDLSEVGEMLQGILNS